MKKIKCTNENCKRYATQQEWKTEEEKKECLTCRIQKAFLKEQLELTPREEKVMSLRFGFSDGQTHSLEEVGKSFGVTRERIRQIEAKCIEKLREKGYDMAF